MNVNHKYYLYFGINAILYGLLFPLLCLVLLLPSSNVHAQEEAAYDCKVSNGEEEEGSYTTLASALDCFDCNSIFIQNGTYRIDHTIEIVRPNISITGESKEGTILEYTGSGSFILVKNTVNVQMKRLTLNAMEHDSNENKIYEAFGVFGSSNVTLSETIVYGSNHMFAIFYAGPYVNAGQDTLDAFFENTLDQNNVVEDTIIYQYATMDVLSFSLQQNGRVANNIVHGGVISFFMNKDSECQNNVIVDSMTQGIFVSVPAENNMIKGNTILNSAASGIKVNKQIDHVDEETGTSLTPNEYRARGIVIKDNIISQTGYMGIEIANTINASVMSNHVANVAYSAIYSLFNHALKVKRNHLVDFGENGEGDFSNFNSGFFGDYFTMEAQIKNNRIAALQSENAEYGIRINNGPEQAGNVVAKNYIEGNYESSYISVSETNNIVRGNTII